MAQEGWLLNNEEDADLEQLDFDLKLKNRPEILRNIMDSKEEIQKVKIFYDTTDFIDQSISYACRYHGVPREKIRFAWTNDLGFDAFATSAIGPNKIYFIGMSCGMPFILGWLYNCLMASPDFLPNVGDIPKNPHFSKIELIDDMGDIKKNKFNFPRCPIRLFIAQFFTTEALKFILFHEFTHIVNGHLKKRQIHSDKIKELPPEDQILLKQKNVVSQTLEMDADAGSIVMLSNTLLANHFAKNKKITSILGIGLEPSIKFLCTMLTFLFGLMYKGSPIITLENIFLTAHPHPGIRLCMAKATLQAHLERTYKASLIDQALEDDNSLEDFYRHIIVRDSDTEENEVEKILLSIAIFYNNSFFVEHSHHLKQCWRELYTNCNLRKLTKHKLAFPDEEKTLIQSYEEYWARQSQLSA